MTSRPYKVYAVKTTKKSTGTGITPDQKATLQQAMCTPIYDPLWIFVGAFGVFNLATGWSLIYNKNATKFIGAGQLLLSVVALGSKYLLGVCK